MSRFRRFGGWLEFDRNGPPLSGTKEQQTAVRAAVSDHLAYGNRFHQTMHAVDVDVNRSGRNFLPVGFWPLHEQGLLGFCFPTYIQLGEQVLPEHAGSVFLHELGHMVGWRLGCWPGFDEHWAEAFKRWLADGQPDGPVWDRLSRVVGNG